MALTRIFRMLSITGIVTASLIAAGTFATIRPAQAQDNGIGVTVDGNPVNFRGAQPIEIHGSVLVPMRGVFENLGADVEYNPDTQTIRAHRGDRHVVVTIGSSTATIDGQPQQLTQPAQMVNGYTMVPLRFVAEALGDYVEWQDENHMVVITTVHHVHMEPGMRPMHDHMDHMDHTDHDVH